MRLSTAGNPLWHPFADMGKVDGQRMVVTRARGIHVWDEAGRRYLDASASLWYANLGHGREEIATAVAKQLETLDAYSIFNDYANPPALRLAERLAGLTGEEGTRVFLGSGGGDMIETAAKIARSFHAQRGEEQRTHLIGRSHGYHGTHGIGTSLGGIPANASGFGPMLADASHVDFDDPAALEAEIERVGSDRVAAFFCEPVIGSGGVHLPPEGYIESVAAICRRHGVLFVADSVICGFGRLGTWFGIDRWDVQPDMVALAKGITGGALPLGALLVAPHVAEPFFPGVGGAPVLRHGPTYAGHPTCCAAANAALDIYEDEGLIERGALLETKLADSLAPLAGHPAIKEVRAGLGFLAGIDLADEILEEDPTAVVAWQRACRAEGILVRPLLRGIAVSPPLTCSEEEVEQIAHGIAAGLNRAAAAMVAA